ncbi:glycerol-3-phosphate 1-O-acyltransferase PlsY [Faecalimonas sp.]
MERLVCLILGYICGLFQTGYIYGRLYHIDIRKHGSGNAGTTNALRTLGWKAGAITFLGDSLKCILAVWIAYMIYGKSNSEMFELLAMYAGIGAVLGHNFPFYLKFKGGKGIAATSGLLLAVNPKVALVAMITFIAVVGITRYVSLGSIILVIIFGIGMVVQGEVFGTTLTQSQQYELYALSVFLVILAVYKHRENIKRLCNGTENKLKFGRK